MSTTDRRVFDLKITIAAATDNHLLALCKGVGSDCSITLNHDFKTRMHHAWTLWPEAAANRRGCVSGQSNLLGSFGATVGNVFAFDGFFQINLTDIGKGRQPGKDISEFLAQVLRVAIAPFSASQRFSKFTNFLTEPEVGPWHTALGIGRKVPFTDQLLEFSKSHVRLPSNSGAIP